MGSILEAYCKCPSIEKLLVAFFRKVLFHCSLHFLQSQIFLGFVLLFPQTIEIVYFNLLGMHERRAVMDLFRVKMFDLLQKNQSFRTKRNFMSTSASLQNPPLILDIFYA